MPLIETKGAASAQGFGEFATSSEKLYIESCFSTYLYTGNGSTQTITNGIDLAGEGGLVWQKSRSSAGSHFIYDTSRGVNQYLSSNTTGASANYNQSLTAFNSNGFTLGFNLSNSGEQDVTWTFRKAPKFFDVVTYTGNGSNRTISHSLGSVPGCIIVKRTDAAGYNWTVYHRSTGNTGRLNLNDTSAFTTNASSWNNTTPTADVFTLGVSGDVNASGGTYVAYLFAHNAGGFGLSGTDNVISCGSFTGTGASSGNIITLGFEPQLMLLKAASVAGDWLMLDTMRGLSVGTTADAILYPNATNAEGASSVLDPLATGFEMRNSGSGINGLGETILYIAIRRGPMKVPTSGTSVFSPVAYQGNADGISGAQTISIGFPSDAYFQSSRTRVANTSYYQVCDRLRGYTKYLNTSATWDESAFGSPTTYMTGFDNQTGMPLGKGAAWNWDGGGNSANAEHIVYALRRAPGFMDVVCYTGTGANRTVSHNLGVVPEVILIKSRSGSRNWNYLTNFGATTYTAAVLNDTYAPGATPSAYDTMMQAKPTSTQFSVSTSFGVNNSGETYVAYLFATVAGVSKVGSYTGSGTTKQIDCGFTAGARFVLIKRTDSTGDWYVWDSARGIVASTDPYLVLNSTAAEVTTTDWVDTYSAGFELSSAAGNNVNINAASYIFLSIS